MAEEPPCRCGSVVRGLLFPCVVSLRWARGLCAAALSKGRCGYTCSRECTRGRRWYGDVYMGVGDTTLATLVTFVMGRVAVCSGGRMFCCFSTSTSSLLTTVGFRGFQSNTKMSRPAAGGYVSLSELLHRGVDRVYEELVDMTLSLKEEGDTERKSALDAWASRSGILFQRLLVLSKWAHGQSKVLPASEGDSQLAIVKRARQAVAESEARGVSLRSAEASLAAMQGRLLNAKVRCGRVLCCVVLCGLQDEGH
jgi:hypothetical protein